MCEEDIGTIYFLNEEENIIYEKYFEFLKIHFPEIYVKFDFITNEKIKNGIIWGLPMSGKSDASIAVLYLFSILNYLPILFVQDSNAISQIENSIENFNKKWLSFFNKGVKVNSVRVKDVDEIQIQSDFFPIHISIANNFAQPEKILKLIEEYNNINIALLADECHKTLFCDTEGARLKNALVKIMGRANKIVGTTATPIRNLMEDEKYSIQWLVKLRPKICYRDLPSLTFSNIDGIKKQKRYDDMELWRFVSWVEDQPKLTREQYKGLVKDELPRLVFISCVSLHKEQEIIADKLCKNCKSRSVYIIHNSEKLSILFSDYFDENELFQFNDVTYGEKGGRVELKNTPLCEVLQKFSDWSDKFSHIYLIGSLCHNQGVRINSKDYKLAITDEFLRVNNATAMDTTTQKVRAVGYRNSEWPINLWCEEKVREDLIKNHKLTEDLIEKLDEEFSVFNATDSYNLLSAKKVNKFKVPKRKIAKKTKAEKILNIISDVLDDDLNSDLSEYNNIMHGVQPYIDDDEAEVLRLVAQFDKWGLQVKNKNKNNQKNKQKNTNKISKFMLELDGTGELYTEQQLRKKLEKASISSSIKHITEYKYGDNSQGYGRIMVKHGAMYKMDERLVESYVKNFL